MSVYDAPRFARLERMQGEISDLIRALNDRELSGEDHASIVIAISLLEGPLERVRSTLARVDARTSAGQAGMR